MHLGSILVGLLFADRKFDENVYKYNFRDYLVLFSSFVCNCRNICDIFDIYNEIYFITLRCRFHLFLNLYKMGIYIYIPYYSAYNPRGLISELPQSELFQEVTLLTPIIRLICNFISDLRLCPQI